MIKRLNNKGISLMELLIVVAIMAVLVGIITPMMVSQVKKARQVKVEKEASEFIKAAKIAYVEVYMNGTEPLADSIKNKTTASSPYYKGGTKYGNLTNWTVKNGTVAGASNGAFAEEFFKSLGIAYGKNKWNKESSSIPISAKEPKLFPAGSMNQECIFQVFYTEKGDMVVEYSRYGFFVRIENSVVVTSVKIKSESEKLFTTWQ